ncbi:ComEA family DNA-binding protein [Melioribacteraceae bacterium 4301-Me]|uniref:ComEA family DNA-binding protein n=1 Tax=Pyranulibacter aquaticus TaxID=3163344 RepID=UPI003599D92B
MATFFVGLSIHIIKDKKQQPYQNFDYSHQDSLFNSINYKDEAEPAEQKNVEKNIDSQQELLDFRNNKKQESLSTETLDNEKININTAGIDNLVLLPGIGTKTAEKIIDYRNKVGKFNKIEDLLNIKGIGNSKLERIKKYITVK